MCTPATVSLVPEKGSLGEAAPLGYQDPGEKQSWYDFVDLRLIDLCPAGQVHRPE